jgi:hypothetical protein
MLQFLRLLNLFKILVKPSGDFYDFLKHLEIQRCTPKVSQLSPCCDSIADLPSIHLMHSQVIKVSSDILKVNRLLLAKRPNMLYEVGPDLSALITIEILVS